jgi:excisionase family DNA binding protein
MTSLLTARELARLLNIAPETALRWYRRGEFGGVALVLPGGAVRFRQDRLEAWLEERATPPRGSTTHPAAGRRPGDKLTGTTHPR